MKQDLKKCLSEAYSSSDTWTFDCNLDLHKKKQPQQIRSKKTLF